MHSDLPIGALISPASYMLSTAEAQKGIYLERTVQDPRNLRSGADLSGTITVQEPDNWRDAMPLVEGVLPGSVLRCSVTPCPATIKD